MRGPMRPRTGRRARSRNSKGGAIGSVPAIVNAIGDALAPLGVTVTSQPLGPNDIFELIHAND